jgi:hypothetical protein
MQSHAEGTTSSRAPPRQGRRQLRAEPRSFELLTNVEAWAFDGAWSGSWPPLSVCLSVCHYVCKFVWQMLLPHRLPSVGRVRLFELGGQTVMACVSNQDHQESITLTDVASGSLLGEARLSPANIFQGSAFG